MVTEQIRDNERGGREGWVGGGKARGEVGNVGRSNNKQHVWSEPGGRCLRSVDLRD